MLGLVFVILVALFIIVLISKINVNSQENFYNTTISPWLRLKDNYYNTEFPNVRLSVTNCHTNLPWWNTQIGSKRNMSYDLRGDLPIYEDNWITPWNIPSRIPISNRPLFMVS